jgi:hypothetical protein
LELKQEGKIEMRGDADAFIVERDRIERELAELKVKQASLEKERAQVARNAETAAGNTEALALLKIETEQMAEAKRQNDRLIDLTTKRLMDVEKNIAMLKQSDII